MSNKYKSSAEIISIEQSVGKVLAHDITEIRPGEFKGAAFKKGHIVTEKDLPHLRRIGKENLYVLHLEKGEVHEDDAALKLSAALIGQGVEAEGDPSEGKISLKAAHRGLLKVNVEALTRLNMVPDICCSSRHNNTLVEKGDIIAATRAIPLIIDEGPLNEAVKIAKDAGGVFSVKPLQQPRTGLIITGSEVYTGLIKDKFGPIIREKLSYFSCEVAETIYTPDEKQKIISAINSLTQKDVGLLMVAGGMSVDPDDITRVAIAEAGAENIVYGTPVLPGAMFLTGKIHNIPVLGLPACVLFYGVTVLDIVLPRILAGEGVTRKDFAGMAHGGLCLNCKECRYPVCPFGK
ncbi:molybdopterin-binding protein [Thermodesulfobacteriota bacterium]